MTEDLVRAAEHLAREADRLAALARSAIEARAVAARWPDQAATSRLLVERLARVGMRKQLDGVVASARGLVEVMGRSL